MKRSLKCGCIYDEDEFGRAIQVCKRHSKGYNEHFQQNMDIEVFVDKLLKEDSEA